MVGAGYGFRFETGSQRRHPKMSVLLTNLDVGSSGDTIGREPKQPRNVADLAQDSHTTVCPGIGNRVA
jgi:hypothetical protein